MAIESFDRARYLERTESGSGVRRLVVSLSQVWNVTGNGTPRADERRNDYGTQTSRPWQKALVDFARFNLAAGVLRMPAAFLLRTQ